MKPQVLTSDQVEEFVERGCVRVEQAFPRAGALAVQEFIWDRLAERGIRKSDRSTWTEPYAHIRESYTDPVFRACATRRLADAVEDVVGRGRWRTREEVAAWGWWPVNFAKGADRPWDVPTGGWHWDGSHFRHFVDAPDQGVVLLCIFSDISPRGGATIAAEGSHRLVARYLNRFPRRDHPEGLALGEAIHGCSRSHPFLIELTGGLEPVPGGSPPPAGPSPGGGDAPPGGARIERFMERGWLDADGRRLRVVELIGSPGDIYLCHPFLYHASSQNHSGVPRFVCNRTTPLAEPMRFDRPDGDYSPVEAAIREAIARPDRLTAA